MEMMERAQMDGPVSSQDEEEFYHLALSTPTKEVARVLVWMMRGPKCSNKAQWDLLESLGRLDQGDVFYSRLVAHCSKRKR